VRFDQLTARSKVQAKAARARPRTAIKFFKILCALRQGQDPAHDRNGNNQYRIIARRAEIDWQLAMPTA